MFYLRQIVAIIIVLLSVNSANCTHNRAGEITYRHISGYTFEVTITTYTYNLSQANRTQLGIDWGDGTPIQQVTLSQQPVKLPNNYLYNTYTAQHTFPGTGIYQILMEDPNRNLGVKNIPNSVNTIFSIKTTMLITPFTGTNSTPVLLNPPIDNAGLNHIFIHNPAAYDPDGDSLSYELTICTAENGNPISGYSLPRASDTLLLEPRSGDLIWTTPIDTGVYNIAMHVDEWRDGIRIGRIARDMQIDVYETDNNPPVIPPIPDYCVLAGDTIDFEFTVTDPDNDPIKVTMTGGPLLDNSAKYQMLEAGQGFTKGKFTWVTNCNHAQQQPYTLVIKAKDEVTDVSLVDISSFFVKVIHKSPENIRLKPGADTIRLDWDQTTCGVAAGYNIYRKFGKYGYSPDSCEYGVPKYTGYELLDIVNGREKTFYVDDNKGLGLVPGIDYCYMVTAFYFDKSESQASAEVCTTLVSGTPPMLQVSVIENDETNGEILVGWAVPYGIDTIDDGPYRYDIYRKLPEAGNFAKIATIPTLDLKDTTYIDQNINTLIYPYNYSIRVSYQNDVGQWVEIPGSEVASSLYLKLLGEDNAITVEMNKRSPWLNYEYHIFKRKEGESLFDSIGITNMPEYRDENLPNDVPFTYKVRSLGTRPLFGRDYFVENLSHINTGKAIDTVPPCPPKPEVTSVCDSSYNLLTWTSPKTVCGSEDVVEYRIYHKSTLDGELNLIATQLPPDTIFRHDENLETLAAVYGVVAVDSFNNVSSMAIAIIDTCQIFELANVFSPNNDGVNDVYTSYNQNGFVKEVNMRIFNRYGQPVYTTNNPDIEWNGYSMDTKQLVSTGVYYYICDVYEPRLTGSEHRTLKGFIHVFSGENNSISE